jgi:hypothetical protein
VKFRSRDLDLPRKAQTADGIHRPAEQEEELNALYRTAFSTPAGREVLAHLQQITMLTPLLPSVSDAELRHMEGMRALVAIVTTRAFSKPATDGGKKNA